jgi:hypothetical protein
MLAKEASFSDKLPGLLNNTAMQHAYILKTNKKYLPQKQNFGNNKTIKGKGTELQVNP